ncbi:MAG: hypothetical protein AAGA37_09245 [Actinomycetota bacterium]
MPQLSADDLLGGGTTTHTITVPPEILNPEGDALDAGTVVIRPLVLADLQRVTRAGGDSNELTSVLIVHRGLVEPALSVEQVNRLHAGLVQFLLSHINRVSGLTIGDDELADAVQAPMARACFTLAKEFGWTPDECANLTVGQVLLYLEMLGKAEPWAVAV